MSDEAFARRFYSDRAELIAPRRAAALPARRVHRRGAVHDALGAPTSSRQLDLDDDELAALADGALPARGQVRLRRAAPARAAEPRPRPARDSREAPTDTGPSRRGARPRVLRRARGTSRKARGRDLEAAHGQVQLLVDLARLEEERSLNPYALFQDNGAWYVVGQDLVREDIRTFRVSRIRGDIRFATRRERDFRLPAEFDIEPYRDRPPWQIGDLTGEAQDRGGRRHRLVGRTDVRGARPRGRRRLRDRVLESGAARLLDRPPGRARFTRRASELRREVARALRLVRDRHEGAPAELAAEAKPRASRKSPSGSPGRSRRSGLRCCRRCSPTCSIAAARSNEAVVDASDLIERFQIPPDEPRGASVAAQPRQLRRRLLRDLRGAVQRDRCASTRSSSATRSALAPRLTPLGGARDPPRARSSSAR